MPLGFGSPSDLDPTLTEAPILRPSSTGAAGLDGSRPGKQSRSSPSLPHTTPSTPTINPLALRLHETPADSSTRERLAMTAGNTTANGADAFESPSYEIALQMKAAELCGDIEMTDGDGAGDADADGDAEGDGVRDDETKVAVAHRKHPLPWSSLKTGLLYDVRMRYHATVDELEGHPEDPRRIYRIYEALVNEGLVDDPEVTGKERVPDLMQRIKAREVTRDEAMLVHGPNHWNFVEKTAIADLEELQDFTESGDSVYFNSESFFCAKLSCGGAIEACKAVVTGAVKNAIAVIRPPGHHAEPHKCMGFCLFNNASVAAKVVLRDCEKIKKIMILDWDVHHGNGTQASFYNDSQVLYVSIHRYGDGKFYPPGTAGNLDKCGINEGAGFNVNIPWETGGMGDGDYFYAFQRVVMPIAMEYNPDLVIISAGFDAAAGDILGGCYVTPAGYAHMTHMLMSLADGKVVVMLEGGYNLDSISNSALAVAKVLMGEPPGAPHEGAVACRKAVNLVQQVVVEQSRYWRNMRPRELVLDMGGEKAALGDVVLAYQKNQLFDDYRMTTYPIYHEKISASFVDRVLATPTFLTDETICIIIHDPPLVTGMGDIETNSIPLEESFLIDPIRGYIDYCVRNGFGVMDISVPRTNDDAYKPLLVYLWDNYIDTADASNILFIGMGESYQAIVHLLAHRDDTYERVRGCIGFFGDQQALPGIQSGVPDDSIYGWYYDNSHIYIALSHAVWTKKTVKKRFGFHIQVLKASELHEVARESYRDAVSWIDKLCLPGRRKDEESAGAVGLGVAPATAAPGTNGE